MHRNPHGNPCHHCSDGQVWGGILKERKATFLATSPILLHRIEAMALYVVLLLKHTRLPHA